MPLAERGAHQPRVVAGRWVVRLERGSQAPALERPTN
jgi:hypothetical protein